MKENDYTKAIRYEYLVRNAFNCERGMKNGADVCFMKNAMTMERGETFAKHLGSFEKQFKVVKTYTSKALLKLSKTKPYSIDKAFYLNLQAELEYSETTNELLKIVNLALDQLLLRKVN